ncbi:hypothetical protein ACRAWD_19065 [Caulobacter segnis]
MSSADILFNPSLTEAFWQRDAGRHGRRPRRCCSPRAPSTSALVADGQDGVLAQRADAEAYARGGS